MSDPVTRLNAALEGRYRVEGRTLVRQLLRRSILCVGVFGVALPASPTFGQQGAQNGEWRSYGGDAGSTKYSPLDAIDETNVQNLEVVWRWESVDYQRQAGRSRAHIQPRPFGNATEGGERAVHQHESRPGGRDQPRYRRDALGLQLRG